MVGAARGCGGRVVSPGWRVVLWSLGVGDYREAYASLAVFFVCVCVCVCVCVLLCFIEPNSTNSGGHGSRGLLIKGLLAWGFRPTHTLSP